MMIVALSRDLPNASTWEPKKLTRDSFDEREKTQKLNIDSDDRIEQGTRTNSIENEVLFLKNLCHDIVQKYQEKVNNRDQSESCWRPTPKRAKLLQTSSGKWKYEPKVTSFPFGNTASITKVRQSVQNVSNMTTGFSIPNSQDLLAQTILPSYRKQPILEHLMLYCGDCQTKSNTQHAFNNYFTRLHRDDTSEYPVDKDTCNIYGKDRMCQFANCKKLIVYGGLPFCTRHGGGRSCDYPGCKTRARSGQAKYCTRHGGGRRCQAEGCSKGVAPGGKPYCILHGGGRRCQYLRCTKGAQGGISSKYCRVHGKFLLGHGGRDK